MRDELEAEPGDAIVIEYFDNAQLGDESVHMEQVRAGAIDVIPLGSDAVQLDPNWAIFDVPFLWGTVAFALIVIAFPQIATFLPSLMQD
jgi:TRAP-type C4-dicarboxylate transport system substrate-binding protein